MKNQIAVCNIFAGCQRQYNTTAELQVPQSRVFYFKKSVSIPHRTNTKMFNPFGVEIQTAIHFPRVSPVAIIIQAFQACLDYLEPADI
jgi:hypothetical protein